MARDGSGRRHSRDDVARAAMNILDRYGLPDLTMRRLAGELDLQPSALYWHFPNKQSLLAEVSDRILAEVEPAPPRLDWSARVGFEASALRAALLAHRDGAEVVASTIALGMGSSRAMAVLSDAIGEAPFDGATADRATSVLLRFALGHVAHEQQQRQYRSLLGEGDGEAAARAARAAEIEFAFGVELIVGGLQRRLEEAAAN